MSGRTIAALALLLCAAPALAQTSAPTRKPDPAAGEIIAKRWCASCHLVAPDQTRASADAPTFLSIAQKQMDEDALAAFLQTPHPRMPDMSLTRDEVADLVAFIGQMAPK